MATLSAPRRATPSVKSGYARNAAESANPGLWRGMTVGFAPILQGGMDHNFGPFRRGPEGHKFRVESDVVQQLGGIGAGANAGGITTSGGIEIPHVNRDGFESDSLSVLAYFENVTDPGHDQFFWNYENNTAYLECLTSTGFVRYGVTNSVPSGRSVNSTTAADDGLPHVCIGVTSGPEEVIKIYFDGEMEHLLPLQAAGLNWPVYDSNRRNMLLASRDNQGTYNLENGKLCECLFWNRALSVDEVSQLSADPLAPFRLRSRVISIPAAAPAATRSAGLIAYHGQH